jgi:hypothetical protein
MRQNRLYIDGLSFVIDACDQSEVVASNVENQALPINIRRLKGLFHVLKAVPLRFERNLVPSVKRRPRTGMFLGEFPDGLERDDVHFLQILLVFV